MARILSDNEALSSWIKKEITLESTLQQGAHNKAARRVQEWLNLSGYGLAVDGQFGPVTAECVKQFQTNAGLNPSGVVDEATYAALVTPLVNVLTPITPDGHTLASLSIAYANQHLAEHPLEVGGNNRGPWVRLYANGNEGNDWPWCAFFVTFAIKQAAETLQISPPIQGSGSCDSLAAQAKQANLFVSEASLKNGAANVSEMSNGAIFLVRRTSTDWTHAGFVTEFGDEIFHTVEGNTNDEGSREGYEVCARTRGYGSKDFIML
jgi:peptidoglycan hydrolase-like protein with peptidoglycan-binding domain